MRLLAVMIFCVACRESPASDDLLLDVEPAAAHLHGLRTDAAVPPPPPPPPPPPGQSAPPPRSIAHFFASDSPLPIEVTVHRLGDRRKAIRAPKTLLGWPIRRARVLKPALAARLIAALPLASSYIDSEYGCVSPDRVGVRLTRGSERVELVYIGCGHVFTEGTGGDAHQDVAEPMIELMKELSRAARS